MIREAIHKHTLKIVDDVITEAQEEIKKRVHASIDAIAVSVLKRYTIQYGRDEISIRVSKEL